MFGAEGLEKGVDVGGQLVDAAGAEHAAGDGQGHRQLRQLRPDQDAGDVDGYGDAIALDESGLVSEGSGQNLFLVRDQVIYTRRSPRRSCRASRATA